MLGGCISDLAPGDVFEHYLRVSLPDAALPALRSLGF